MAELIYILKFGASFVLPPGIIIVPLFYLAWRLKRDEPKTSAAVAAVTLLLYLASMPLVAGRLMRWHESICPPTENPVGDVVIVLGSGVWDGIKDDGTPGALPAVATARVFAAARLAKKLNVPLIAVGGNAQRTAAIEAEVTKKILLSLGFADSEVLTEGKSRTTGENARNCAAILKERGFQRPLLVTSAAHMERSVLNFAKNGVAVVPCPSDYNTDTTEKTTYLSFSPSADALAGTALVLREQLRTFVTRYIE